ncbi:MAG: carboxypeptidase-like regulatory domain-containing protein, partial [Blastocatellia bacterium]
MKNAIDHSSWRHGSAQKVGVLLFALTLVIGCLPISGHAQVPTGSITGVITDQNGAVIPDAKITITSKATGRVTNTTSTGGGSYVVGALTPGDYTVKVEAANFKTGVLAITVEVGKTSAGNVSLETGT